MKKILFNFAYSGTDLGTPCAEKITGRLWSFISFNSSMKIAPLCDILFVVGSKNSSNSLRLVEVAKKSGCTNSFLISSVDENQINNFIKYKNIGITSGASAPEKLVHDIIAVMKKKTKVTINEVEVAKENVFFKIPNNLN